MTAFHACYFCRQAGQTGWPVTLTFEATELTPAHLPGAIEVETWACVGEALCRRVAAAQHPGGRRPKWAGRGVHREVVERVQ